MTDFEMGWRQNWLHFGADILAQNNRILGLFQYYKFDCLMDDQAWRPADPNRQKTSQGATNVYIAFGQSETLAAWSYALLESHPWRQSARAEVRSHVVWLRICLTAADNHLVNRDQIALVLREAFTQELRARVADQKWLAGGLRIMPMGYREPS
jgi:hypothetical protein